MTSAPFLLLAAFVMCALPLIAAAQHITKLRTDMNGWRQIAIDLAVELRDLRGGC